MNGPGIDGANTEVSAAQRLRDYLEDSRYPGDSRPARGDAPVDIAKWPGLPQAVSDGAEIQGYVGEQLRDGSLYVEIAVVVREAGRYSFFTVLRRQADRQPLIVATVTRDLPPGAARVPFEFYGLILREAGTGSSDTSIVYEIPAVGGERIPNDAELDELLSGKRETNPAGRLPPLREMYETRAYRPDQFTDREWNDPEKRRRIAELEAEVRAENQTDNDFDQE